MASSVKALLILFSTIFVLMANMQILTSLLPDIMRALAIGPERGGILSGVFTVAVGASLLVFAPMSDRAGRRRMMTMGLGVFCVGTLLAAFAWDYTSLLLARLVSGAGFGIVSPNIVAYLGDRYPYERRAFPIGLVTIGFFAGRYLGVGVAAFFVDAHGWRSAFLAMLAMAALTWWGLRSLPEASRPGAAGKPPKRSLARYRSVLARGRVQAMMVINPVLYAPIVAMLTFIGTGMVNDLHTPTADVGLALMAAGVAGIIGSPLAGKASDRFGKRPVFIWSSIVSGAMTAALPFTGFSLAAIATVFGVMIFCGPFRGVPYQSLVSEMVPESRAVTLALYEFSRHIGLTIGAVMAGFIYARWGFEALGLISACSTGAAAVLFALLLREIAPGKEYYVPSAEPMVRNIAFNPEPGRTTPSPKPHDEGESTDGR